ncbi:hypothetical protein [Arabiibacter massiliensis]|uniref:hypothetical protein n=1 Tax=Arabiibacter massiliensis TaxID=1870985 RepID=UPI0009BB5F21|nr:hypothetical protein [Arabiibacter massiliensis]
MQKSSSQKALKVIAIIMIVFAALSIAAGLLAMAGGGLAGYVGVDSSDDGAVMLGGFAMLLGFVALLGGAIDLLIGIFGLRGANDPSKIGVFYVFAIIGLVLAVLDALGTFFGGNADGSDIFGAIVGIILPLVCVLLASNIKKENSL